MSAHTDTMHGIGREYVRPNRPLVIVCIGGSEPDYHERDRGWA